MKTDLRAYGRRPPTAAYAQLMIRSHRAFLAAQSTITTPAEISDILTLEPTDVPEMGSVSRSGRVREHHNWSIQVDTLDNTGEDQTEMQALRTLLEHCIPARGRVKELPTECDARIWWSGDSDSNQGGFVVEADLAQMITALGIDLMATVYFDDDETVTCII